MEEFDSLNQMPSHIRGFNAMQTVGDLLTAILAKETVWGAVFTDMHRNAEALPRQTPRAWWTVAIDAAGARLPCRRAPNMS